MRSIAGHDRNSACRTPELRRPFRQGSCLVVAQQALTRLMVTSTHECVAAR
jgi:hypothetical protein